MKYKIPAGTKVNRGKSLGKDQKDQHEYFHPIGYSWHTYITTKNAYYTDRDVIRNNENYIIFVVPDTRWNLVECRIKEVERG